MTAERLYAVLLRLYPAVFRREYGEAMAEAFRDGYRDHRRRRARFWLSIIVDVGLSACREHLQVWREGGQVTTVGLAADRRMLWKPARTSALSLAGGVLVAFAFIRPIIRFVMQPVLEVLRSDAVVYVYTTPTDAFVLYEKPD